MATKKLKAKIKEVKKNKKPVKKQETKKVSNVKNLILAFKNMTPKEQSQFRFGIERTNNSAAKKAIRKLKKEAIKE